MTDDCFPQNKTFILETGNNQKSWSFVETAYVDVRM